MPTVPSRAGRTNPDGAFPVGPSDEPACNLAFAATLIDEWVRCGVRHVVCAPGSRSAPLALAAIRHPGVETHAVLDERVAGFAALGVGRASGRPAVVITTSGTAAVHLHAAVVEADLAAVPLLAVTADRPPELHGVLAPQTIDQQRLFGGSPRWFVSPGPPSRRFAGQWRGLAREAFARAMGSPPGPVHCNLAFREPLVDEGEGPTGIPEPGAPLPPRRPSWGVPDEVLAQVMTATAGRRVLLVAGERCATTPDEAAGILGFARQRGWPVLADHLSGLRSTGDANPGAGVAAGGFAGGVIGAADQLLRVEGFASTHRPDAVIRFGGLLASRVCNQWLGGLDVPQFAVDRFGVIPDPDRVIGTRIVAPPAAFCGLLERHGAVGAPDGWWQSWCEAQDLAEGAISGVLDGDGAWGGAAVTRAVTRSLGMRGVADQLLVVSSSMPIRDLEWFGGPTAVRVLANRGANGIDGVIATALGASWTGVAVVVLVGDVAAVHDLGGCAALAREGAPVTVVVPDNGGGAIFSFLPYAGALRSGELESAFTVSPGLNLAEVGRALGLDVLEVDSTAALVGCLSGDEDGSGWTEPQAGARLVVARTSVDQDVEVHRVLAAAVRSAVERLEGTAGRRSDGEGR